MAAIITNQGLSVGLRRIYNISSEVAVQKIAVDDSSTAFTPTDTALNSGGAVSNVFGRAIDTKAETGQTATVDITLATSEGNFTIRRISTHNTAGSVTASSTTLCAGVDAQSLTKNSDFTLRIELEHSASDVS